MVATLKPRRPAYIPAEDRIDVAVYNRISSDDYIKAKKGEPRRLKEGRGVTRQSEANNLMVGNRGWRIVTEQTDNDLSATSGVERPGFLKILELIEAGKVNRIVCAATSRLVRNRVERAAFIGTGERFGVIISPVAGLELDLSTSQGRMLFDQLGVYDSVEPEFLADRVNDALRDNAKKGRRHGQVPFGWAVFVNPDGTKQPQIVVPAQAAVVNEIVDALLEGESLRELARRLNDRGLPLPRGEGKWSPTQIRQLAVRPANVGLRTFNGAEFPAAWPPIVDPDKHNRVIALVSGQHRKSTPHPSVRRHFLSYFANVVCGVCGGVLTARTEHSKAHNGIYCCVVGHVARNMTKVDDEVSANVIAWLRRRNGIFDRDDTTLKEAHERVAAIQAKLSLAGDKFAAMGVSTEMLAMMQKVTAPLLEELEQAKQEVDRLRPRPVRLDNAIASLQGEQAEVEWEAMPLTQRRAVIAAIGLTVKVLPHDKTKGGVFIPEELKFDWPVEEKAGDGLDDVRAFVASATFKVATSMPEIPHAYVSRRGSDEAGFDRLVEAIKQHGKYRKHAATGRSYKYLDLDGFCFWLMKPPFVLVNRAAIPTE